MISKSKLKEHVEITLTCEPETEPYVGNCSAIDLATDREQEEWIRSELASGNEWAWCTAVVSVSYAEHTEETALGCCSYENRNTFITGPYYLDLVGECLDNLHAKLTQLDKQLAKVRGGTRKRKS